MFGKLLKYELKSAGKWYLSLYGLVLGLSLVLGIWIRSAIQRSLNQGNEVTNSEGWIFMILWFAFLLLVAGLAISTFVLILNRFYKNVYGRQGYLTMTLPVSSHQIIFSKFTAAVIWNVLAGATILISFFVLASLAIPSEAMPDVLLVFKNFWQGLQEIDPGDLFLFIAQVILGNVASLFIAYLSISIGQLFKDHRLLMAFVSYFGIQFVLFSFNIIRTIGMGYVPNDFFDPITLIQNIVLILAGYFGTHYIMTKKLNL